MITNNFKTQWITIKNSERLKHSSLKDFEDNEIRYHINKGM
jgi:hypothetical protein